MVPPYYIPLIAFRNCLSQVFSPFIYISDGNPPMRFSQIACRKGFVPIYHSSDPLPMRYRYWIRKQYHNRISSLSHSPIISYLCFCHLIRVLSKISLLPQFIVFIANLGLFIKPRIFAISPFIAIAIIQRRIPLVPRRQDFAIARQPSNLPPSSSVHIISLHTISLRSSQLFKAFTHTTPDMRSPMWYRRSLYRKPYAYITLRPHVPADCDIAIWSLPLDLPSLDPTAHICSFLQ